MRELSGILPTFDFGDSIEPPPGRADSTAKITSGTGQSEFQTFLSSGRQSLSIADHTQADITSPPPSGSQLANLIRADRESIAMMMLAKLLPSVDSEFDPDADVPSISFSAHAVGLKKAFAAHYQLAQVIDNGLNDDGLSDKS